MKTALPKYTVPSSRKRFYVMLVILLILATFAAGLLVILFTTYQIAYKAVEKTAEAPLPYVEAFPLGVDPLQKSIVENPIVQEYLDEHSEEKVLALEPERGWFKQALSKLALFDWYQNLASPSTRILVIEPGERKEQVAENFGNILKWDRAMIDDFIEQVTTIEPHLEEGKFFPGVYIVTRNARPDDVAPLVIQKFESEILSRYSEDIEKVVPLSEALKIASLLEREAYSFEDMRHISGVVWNRLFINMPLQLDASLQYAKATQNTGSWWPRVLPKDKYIDSPFNTYKYEGLPPLPISNPSLPAVLAALNPKKTDCMFYFHDSSGEFYCSKTYEEHVGKLRQLYGRGR